MENLYPFLHQIGGMVNSGQHRALLLTGNIYDLFHDGGQNRYVPLLELLTSHWRNVRSIVHYEINGPIRFVDAAAQDRVAAAWTTLRTGLSPNDLAIRKMLDPKLAIQPQVVQFDKVLKDSTGNPTVALEVLRQLCVCSRMEIQGAPLISDKFIIIVEQADMIMPAGDIAHLSDNDRHRINICYDWITDPHFTLSHDIVVFLSESKSTINQRIARLPQLASVEVPAPDLRQRQHFVQWFSDSQSDRLPLDFEKDSDELIHYTGGLSIHSLDRLLRRAAYTMQPIRMDDIINQLEDFIQNELGEDVIEVKRPTHTLEDVVGFTSLKSFLREEFIPRLRSTGGDALGGCIVCGPNGAGKTFIFEGVAGEAGILVLVLKNLRSQWFGQTDVIFERLRRILLVISRVLVFVDEADTQFGNLGRDTHDTERRLIGKIQSMMSDSALKGRITWLLMTARIHLLSPDLRRPGRGGDMIIPILDPTDHADREQFTLWMASDVHDNEGLLPLEQLNELTRHFYVATYQTVRKELKAKRSRLQRKLSGDEICGVVHNIIQSPIIKERQFQTLHALIHCSHRNLLPDPKVSEEEREQWVEELQKLEISGIS